MNLYRKPPAGVLYHGIDAGFHISLSLHFIFTKTRLQETMSGLNAFVLRQILTKIDHFQFITSLQHTRLQIASLKNGLGRKRHPIEVVRQRSRTIGFEGNGLVRFLLQFRHKRLVNEQRWLAACQHKQWCERILIDFIHNLLQRHHLPVLMLRVAKRTAQVASAKAHKDRRRSGVITFALKGVEYFVYFVHGFFFSQNLQNRQNYLLSRAAPNRVAAGKRAGWPLSQPRIRFCKFCGFCDPKINQSFEEHRP